MTMKEFSYYFIPDNEAFSLKQFKIGKNFKSKIIILFTWPKKKPIKSRGLRTRGVVGGGTPVPTLYMHALGLPLEPEAGFNLLNLHKYFQITYISLFLCHNIICIQRENVNNWKMGTKRPGSWLNGWTKLAEHFLGNPWVPWGVTTTKIFESMGTLGGNND